MIEILIICFCSPFVLVFDAVGCMNLSSFLINIQGSFLIPPDSDPITFP